MERASSRALLGPSSVAQAPTQPRSLMQHIGRRVEQRFNDNGKYKFFAGTIKSYDEAAGEHVVDFDDGTTEACELSEDSCFKEWRFVDHAMVGKRIRRFVDADRNIVGDDTGAEIFGTIVGWLSAADSQGVALWHAELRGDAQKLEEDLYESEAAAAIEAAKERAKEEAEAKEAAARAEAVLPRTTAGFVARVPAGTAAACNSWPRCLAPLAPSLPR